MSEASIVQKLKGKLFTFAVKMESQNAKVAELAAQYFSEEYQNLVKDCDKVFAILMGFQWAFSVLLALILTPLTYSGASSSIHFHVWLALVGGGVLALGPIYLYLKEPGAVINRYVNVIAQGLFSALLITLCGGRIETHFHVFGSLAFFAFYRDIRVLLAGTLVVAGDHMIRGLFFAESVYGMPDPTNLRWLEHAGWVVFEDLFLAYSCVRARYEMKVVALKRAEVEDQKSKVELIVEERTEELVSERNSMKVILNNVGQGLFTIENSGYIANQCSNACSSIFSKDIRNLHIVDIFGDDKATWNDLLEMLFNESKNNDSLLALLPDKLKYQEKSLKFDYKITKENNKVKSVLCVVSDMTLVEALENRNEEVISKNAALIKVLSHKNDFVEVMELTESLNGSFSDRAEAKRKIHTLKGSLAFLECRWLSEICHNWETQLDESLDFNRLMPEVYQNLKNELEKFVKDNAHVLKINTDQQMVQVGITSFINALKYVSSFNPDPKIYDEFDKMMMVPIADELNWLSDVFVRTGQSFGKQVDPILFRSDEKIPTKVYRNLFRSFIHIARNSAEHGIEDDTTREQNGKSEPGRIEVKLFDHGSAYEIHFKDNGRGIDSQAFKNSLTAKGIAVPDDESKIFDLIFEDGISTKDQISEISGRGVGLNSVKAEAKKLGGDSFVINELGQGLTIVVQFKKMKFSQMSINQSYKQAA